MEKRHILFKKIFCPFTSRFGAPREQSVLPPPGGLLRLADKKHKKRGKAALEIVQNRYSVK